MSNAATLYENSVLGDILDVMNPDDMLEFAIEIHWLKDCVGDDQYTKIIDELRKLRHMPWRNGLRVALTTVVPGARIDVECPPHKN